jgi:hypothetical protein
MHRPYKYEVLMGRKATPFWDRVKKAGDGDCWPWMGCRDIKGYGRIWIRGKDKMTHRVAWELTNGPIPEGICVLHICDNPPCCNLKHLWLGTQQANVRDCISKGRFIYGWLLGEQNLNAKLTEEEAKAIFIAMNRDGKKWQELAEQYGISRREIYSIAEGRCWKWATEGILGKSGRGDHAQTIGRF